jgi:hypothetical protein
MGSYIHKSGRVAIDQSTDQSLHTAQHITPARQKLTSENFCNTALNVLTRLLFVSNNSTRAADLFDNYLPIPKEALGTQ